MTEASRTRRWSRSSCSAPGHGRADARRPAGKAAAAHRELRASRRTTRSTRTAGGTPTGPAPGSATPSGRPDQPTRCAGRFDGPDRLSRRWRPGWRGDRCASTCGSRSPARATTRTARRRCGSTRDLLGGPIVVTEELRDQETDRPVVFDPTRVVDGIELSDDPILRYRASAYRESIRRAPRVGLPRLGLLASAGHAACARKVAGAMPYWLVQRCDGTPRGCVMGGAQTGRWAREPHPRVGRP